MDLLIRPSLFNSEGSLEEIRSLLSGKEGLSFALFLSQDHLVLANSDFIKKWRLMRTSFPRYSLSDFANQNALQLSGEALGKFWNWFSNPTKNQSLIDLPDSSSSLHRFLLRVPTEIDTGNNPFFLELETESLPPKQKEELLLLGRRLRGPVRTVVRNTSDEPLINHFFQNELATDPDSAQAQVYLAKGASWSGSGGFWRIRNTTDGRNKLMTESLTEEESRSQAPFRRIQFSKNASHGFWADFPLLYNRSFFGKVRLFRPTSRKQELPALSSFQPKARLLAKGLFEIRQNLGDLHQTEREPESGFLDRREALLLLEALILEERIAGNGFGVIGVSIHLPNHKSLMLKVRSVLRVYDEIAHLTTHEYILVLPAMDPKHAPDVIERVRDMILGTNRDQETRVTFGCLSYPEIKKGPMNLIRSVFTIKDSQPIHKKQEVENRPKEI